MVAVVDPIYFSLEMQSLMVTLRQGYNVLQIFMAYNCLDILTNLLTISRFTKNFTMRLLEKFEQILTVLYITIERVEVGSYSWLHGKTDFSFG